MDHVLQRESMDNETKEIGYLYYFLMSTLKDYDKDGEVSFYTYTKRVGESLEAPLPKSPGLFGSWQRSCKIVQSLKRVLDESRLYATTSSSVSTSVFRACATT
jgi:hypothetical protein